MHKNHSTIRNIHTFRCNFDLLVCMLEHVLFVAEDGHHIMLGPLAFF